MVSLRRASSLTTAPGASRPLWPGLCQWMSTVEYHMVITVQYCMVDVLRPEQYRYFAVPMYGTHLVHPQRPLIAAPLPPKSSAHYCITFSNVPLHVRIWRQHPCSAVQQLYLWHSPLRWPAPSVNQKPPCPFPRPNQPHLFFTTYHNTPFLSTTYHMVPYVCGRRPGRYVNPPATSHRLAQASGPDHPPRHGCQGP